MSIKGVRVQALSCESLNIETKVFQLLDRFNTILGHINWSKYLQIEKNATWRLVSMEFKKGVCQAKKILLIRESLIKLAAILALTSIKLTDIAILANTQAEQELFKEAIAAKEVFCVEHSAKEHTYMVATMDTL